MRKRRAVGNDDRVDDLAGRHVALEEAAHVRVRFPQVRGIFGFDADAMRPEPDGRKHVLDHPRDRIDAINHATWRDRDPQFAVLRLDPMGTGTRGRWTRIAGDSATAPDSQTVTRALSRILARLDRATTAAAPTATATARRHRFAASGCSLSSDFCAVGVRTRGDIRSPSIDDA